MSTSKIRQRRKLVVSNEGVKGSADKLVFKTTDPTGVNVLLYKNQWDHIKERHSEIKPVGKVRAAVSNPDIIQSNEERNARIYSVATATNMYHNVYAGIESETECSIRTSYITRDLPKEDLIWQRPRK